VAGYVLTVLVALFLTFDTVIKLLKLAPAVEGTTKLGYPADTVLWIGMIELVCLALYLLPRTAVMGAMLLTGYHGISRRHDRDAPAHRQSAVEPHPLSDLRRSYAMGRPVSPRDAFARAGAVPALK
jgi:DoxX-like family